ncbi:hypothetical protein [Motiliproteus coralliicola]
MGSVTSIAASCYPKIA